MPMFTIGAAAAELIDDDDRSPAVSENGITVDRILVVPEKNADESTLHNLLTHRTSTISNDNKQVAIGHSTHPPLKRVIPIKPPLIPKFSIGQISINSAHSVISTNYGEHFQGGRWIDDKTACDHFTSLLSSVYGLLLTIFSLALEISETFNAQEHIAEMIFYAYMYGGALFFFGFCYLFVLYPGWCDLLQTILKKYGCIGGKVLQIDKPSHTGEGAGSLYLRLGTVCFGTVGIVYYGLEIFLCTTNNSCHSTEYEKYTLGALFTFLQMHFIFCNSKVRINGSKNLSKFGTMHLVAVNLWTWFKYVLAKQAAKNSKLAKESYKGGDSDSSSSEEINSDYDYALNLTFAALKKATTAASSITSTTSDPCFSANDFFGDTATLMTTCVVEFSLIGAGVMFVMWKTIGTADASLPGGRHGRKHRMRVDCSASSTGLFAGLLFLVAAFVSIGVFSALTQLAQSKLLQLVFGLSDLALFLISLIGCALGLWRMRQLSYSHRGHGNAEVLDEILLIIGLIGEVTFCSAGLIGWVGTQYVIQRQPVYILFIYVARISQVLLQTVFILLSGRLRALGATTQQMKPGKQFVTFLLVANVTLFLFHTFQGQRSGVGYSNGSSFFGAQSWSFLIQAVSPLIVFYRFHSSVCLAEIWKHCYTFKDSEHGGGHGNGQTNSHGGLSRSASVRTMIY